jgi:hypothetical protein
LSIVGHWKRMMEGVASPRPLIDGKKSLEAEKSSTWYYYY